VLVARFALRTRLALDDGRADHEFADEIPPIGNAARTAKRQHVGRFVFAAVARVEAAAAGRIPDGRNFIGELVICAPVVERETRAQCKTRDQHWAHMTVHGVLHLLGFDHEGAADARKMAKIEVQILDRLGFSNPYA
jgi:rRNA maturation RNase YbeY